MLVSQWVESVDVALSVPVRFPLHAKKRKDGGLAMAGRTTWGMTLLSTLLACGGSPPKKVVLVKKEEKVAPPKVMEVHERVVPRTCGTRTKVAQLLGKTTPAKAPTPDEKAESAPPPPASTDKKLATQEVYRLVAPATVLIRSDKGMGTGVVIDAAGYALTNYHVVESGRLPDLTIKVQVDFGRITATGRMVKEEKSYDAVVVKADPVRDLAVIKIADPPKNLRTAKLARSAPQVGESVLSVGHAGIGFLWAVKTCGIASVGERQQDMSVLSGFKCDKADPSLGKDEAEAQKKQCEEFKKRVNDSLAAQTQGLAVQTDCAVTHGDSGGPLVNSAGEIVGLNQSISADKATASFHVHVDEIRDFVAKVNDKPAYMLPDPFCDGGINTTLEDIDLDGTPDTLVTKGMMGFFGGFDRMGLLIDLDQDHFTRKKAPHEPFDAEVAVISTRDMTYVWYDADADSRFDIVLVDKGGDGKPDQAYRIAEDGTVTEDKALVPNKDIDTRLIQDPSMHARLGKIANAVGAQRMTSVDAIAAGSRDFTIPDPATGGGTEGRVRDTDGNGKPDLVFVRGSFSRGLLVDADEDSIGQLKPGDPADELLKNKRVDAEIAVILQGNAMWAFYDTDSDTKYDLVLMTPDAKDEEFLVAASAWKVSPTGERTPAPEHVGRKMLRPGLVDMPRAFTAFRGSPFDLAKDEGMGSLPDPRAPEGDFSFRDIPGFPKGTVIQAGNFVQNAILFDLDRDTKLPPNANPEELVNSGKFDAEVAVIHRGSQEWVYYDTDGDNVFDVGLYVPNVMRDDHVAFVQRKGTSKVEIDAELSKGRTIRHKSIFKDKPMALKFRTLAEKIFKKTAIEE